VAGVFARTDNAIGVHKAPANEPIYGVVDIDTVDDVECANPLRAFPGRGIRVWGARTLAVATSPADPNAFVGVRRLMLTLDRWLLRALDWLTFEANDFRLWVRVHRELNAHLEALFLRGAFQGRTSNEAFYVKCDAENNPPDAQALGRLQINIGVAPAVPKEFIQIRVVRSAEGITVT
jgi:phage tail sheath protein FI